MCANARADAQPKGLQILMCMPHLYLRRRDFGASIGQRDYSGPKWSLHPAERVNAIDH
jgi:hypothetical protein